MMKLFLIEYDRERQMVLRDVEFSLDDLARAHSERINLEVEALASGRATEIVLLRAESHEALLQTHERYFRTPQQMYDSAMKAAG
jgi:hypothetical protein